MPDMSERPKTGRHFDSAEQEAYLNLWRTHDRLRAVEDELFAAYDQTDSLCMTLQTGVYFDEYYRCYVIGQEKVHIMPYDPRQPHHLRYVKDGKVSSPAMESRVTRDCLTLCRALGYDFNTVEFAVENGIPYAIDFLNPAAHLHPVW